jgi:tetratricopeptide (TPR) repeat protein
VIAAVLPLLLAAVGVSADDPATLIAEGDAQYARRAEGATGARAVPGPVEQAVAAYRRAVETDPESLLARGRLVRALFFRASFCGAAVEERKRLLEEAKAVGDEGMRRLDARVGSAQGAARTEALRKIPDAAAMHFWTAVAWGEWALVRGKLAAARQGAGGRIRDLGQAVVDLDPAFEQGGGYRILGRLHAESPKIPFITGWVSRDKAIAYLRQALGLGPQNTVNQVFLAEALLDHDRARRDEARALLERCAATAPRPEFLVEDAHYVEVSRRLLAQMR